MAMDSDMAEMVYEQVKLSRKASEDGEDQTPSDRSPEDYSPVIQILQVLDEHVQSLIRITIGVNGDGKTKVPDVNQWPRPFTAVMALEHAEESDDMSDLADAFGIKH